jgi:hypothetical protein
MSALQTPSPASTPAGTPNAFSLLRRPVRRSIAQQLKDASIDAVSDADILEDLPRLFWQGRSFVLESWIHAKGQRGRKTWIKEHGTFLGELNAEGAVASRQFSCGYCDRAGASEFFNVTKATTSAADHLRT